MTTADADTHGRPGKPQGGARVPRKEDARHLHGKGNFVADMAMPGLSEVAFLRSPLAHARIASVRVASQIADKAFVRQAMADARDIVADSTLPSYQVSAQPPLASGKVRFVGEPVAMVVAPTRAEAEDYAELIEVDYDDLPVYADVASAQAAQGDFVHEQWRDNVFVTLMSTSSSTNWRRRRTWWCGARSTWRGNAWCRWRARRCWPTGTIRLTSWWWSAPRRCRT